MSRTSGDTGLDGFLNVCKPSGPTSHDVVAGVRRIFGTRRVGHAGTLDPLAEGVLPLALGRATRLIQLLADSDKSYFAEVRLGCQTTTDDAAGEVICQQDVTRLARKEIDTGLALFIGTVEQVPPSYSALKITGRRAYDLARRGQSLALEGRRVTIYEIECLGWRPPILMLRVRCSKGTYIRSLARDLGQSLGVGGSLSRLVRLGVGPFRLEDSLSLPEIGRRERQAILPPDALMLDKPALILDAVESEHLRHGRAWSTGTASAPFARAYTLQGQFAGPLGVRAGRWQPKIVFLNPA